MTDPTYLFEEWRRFERGMAPHYLFLWTTVLNLEAECVFEFGAGLSTKVILNALEEQGKGKLYSISTDPRETIKARYNIKPTDQWDHLEGLSQNTVLWAGTNRFDLVLHDGSHSTEVVETDLRWAISNLKQFGLALIHDTQNSYVGTQMREAVCSIVSDFDVTHVTLPFGSGLTILRKESREVKPIKLTRNKVGDPNKTEPTRIQS